MRDGVYVGPAVVRVIVGKIVVPGRAFAILATTVIGVKIRGMGRSNSFGGMSLFIKRLILRRWSVA